MKIDDTKKPAKKRDRSGISLRGKTWCFRKSHEGKQRWVSLRTNLRSDAITKKAQFLVTYKNYGWDAATAELRGKRVLRKGESPTLEDIEKLYREFMTISKKPVAENTLTHNIGCLRRLMALCKAKDIASFDPSKLKWTEENTIYLSSQIRAARSIFKKDTLAFWLKQGTRIINPFSEEGEKLSVRKGEYIPIGQKNREQILKDMTELPERQQIIIQLALLAGFRRGEIDAARLSWLVKDKAVTILTVKEEIGFKPKGRVHRSIQIPNELAAELMKLRNHCDPDASDPFLVPSLAPVAKASPRGPVKNTGSPRTIRLQSQYQTILPWLSERGLKGTKALHGLRKEAGSVVATAHGMFQAQKFLGHASIVTTESYYANLTKSVIIDMRGLILTDGADPYETVAKELGISVGDLKAMKGTRAA